MMVFMANEQYTSDEFKVHVDLYNYNEILTKYFLSINRSNLLDRSI